MICDSGSGSHTDAAFSKIIWFDSPPGSANDLTHQMTVLQMAYK